MITEHRDSLARHDIAGLAAQLCRAACRSSGHAALELSWPAIFALEQADWYDVAELGKAVSSAVDRAHAERCPRVERRHVFPIQRQWTSFHEATRRFQEQYLRDVLEREDWNLAAVARALDLIRTHVYNLIAGFGHARPPADPIVIDSCKTRAGSSDVEAPDL